MSPDRRQVPYEAYQCCGIDFSGDKDYARRRVLEHIRREHQGDPAFELAAATVLDSLRM